MSIAMFLAGAVAVAALPAVAKVAQGSRPLRGRIIFARAGGRYRDETVFTAHADGTHQRRLTGFGATCCPRISRDGKRLLLAASAADGRVTTATMGIDGSGYQALPLPPGTLNLGPGTWSPDGRWIAFQGWDDKNPADNGIYMGSSSDAGDLRRLTTVASGSDLPGDFSPDGRRIAFFRERPDVQSVGSIWVINVDGTGLRRITPASIMVGFGTVRWSPDGKTILFASGRTSRRGVLWTVHPNGSHLKKLYQDKRGRFAISPTWSPNGTRIMFALDPIGDEEQHPVNSLDVINADGTGLTKVIGGRDFKREPEWVR